MAVMILPSVWAHLSHKDVSLMQGQCPAPGLDAHTGLLRNISLKEVCPTFTPQFLIDSMNRWRAVI